MAYRSPGLNHLAERIVPFFEKHSLKSRKRVDFARFRKILHLTNQGKHLKAEGIEEYGNSFSNEHRTRKIKSGFSGNKVVRNRAKDSLSGKFDLHEWWNDRIDCLGERLGEFVFR